MHRLGGLMLSVGAVCLVKMSFFKPIIKLPALVLKGSKMPPEWADVCILTAAVMAGCCQPHNMHTCCNWEVVLPVKWKNTSVITNGCCNWQDLLIRVVELAGNLEIIWTLSQSPELYCAVREASHPSSHHIRSLLSWPHSSFHCRKEKGVA